MVIGVKFCGNCNPVIDSLDLFARVKFRLGQMTFTRWDNQNIDALLVINRCQTGCATIPQYSGRIIVVAGNSIQWRSVNLKMLLDVLISELQALSNS